MKSVLLSLGPFLASKSSEWMAQESMLRKKSAFLVKIMRNFTFKMLLGVLPKTTTRGCCPSFLNQTGGLNACISTYSSPTMNQSHFYPMLFMRELTQNQRIYSLRS